MRSEHEMEQLVTAYDAATRAASRVAMGDLSRDAIFAEMSAINRLYDASLNAGMSPDEPTVNIWAVQHITDWMGRL